MDHLLLHYEMVCALWNAFSSLIGLAWVMPSQVVDLSPTGNGYLVGFGILLCGRWSHRALCSVFGGKEMMF